MDLPNIGLGFACFLRDMMHRCRLSL